MNAGLRMAVAGPILLLTGTGFAAKLLEVKVVDEQHLMVHWADGAVIHIEAPRLSGAVQNQGADRLEAYGKPLDISKAVDALSYRVRSSTDVAFVMGGSPTACYRKTKVNGTAWKWPDPDLTYEHTIFLRLAQPMKVGSAYTLAIDSSVNSDLEDFTFTFDPLKNFTEAIHVNLVGARPGQAIKSADLYMWLGDGGSRDYSSFVGRQASILDVKTGKTEPVGRVKFWKPSGKDFGDRNLTQSPVWTCDFSDFTKPGSYALVVEGVGRSPSFEIKDDAWYEPFRTSVRGFYYMRIGEPETMDPTPRQPRFIPGQDPKDFKVYLTTYGPWHPDWKKRGGDQWDNRDWSMYKEPGSPTNPKAYGGHSDALDWDRHLGHISIIWDMLLPFLLSNGMQKEDDLGIRESKNGVPDLLDEAQNEVDFWLRLRDGKGGYATGLNNPSEKDTVMYQAAAKPYMAWANAANSAMLAAAYWVAKKPDLAAKYKAAALEAWKIANEQDLDVSFGIGNGSTRGRDHKALAAACLYIVTGEKKWEDFLAKETVITTGSSETERTDSYNQLYSTAAYLMTAKHRWRPIHRPALVKSMTEAVVKEAIAKNVLNSEAWPSRRSSDNAYGWFQTTQEVQRVCVAHAVAKDAATRLRLEKAMILEADWGLGRNPMNMTQMTGIGSRSPQRIYTSGGNDGTPGVHPGHTPYMNADAWSPGFMGDPQYYAGRGYPEWSKWPHGEALWTAQYCYSNSEFTPQQTMRGKMCLLGYLYALGAPKSARSGS